MDGLNECLAQAFTARFFISNAPGRSVAALGGSMRVGAGDEHLLRFPAGHLGCGCLGFITHFTAHTDGVHHGDHHAAFAIFKRHRAHVQGVMHIGGFARTQLEGFHGRRNIHDRCADPEAGALKGEGGAEGENEKDCEEAFHLAESTLTNFR